MLSFALTVALASQDPPPAVAADFTAAEAAWRDGDLAQADTLFKKINDVEPSWDRAWRRRCGVLLADARPVEAVALCREAVKLSASVENRTALAIALLRPAEDEDPAGRVELIEAKTLLDSVIAERADYLDAWPPLCDWAVANADLEVLERCVTKLEGAQPEQGGTYYFKAVLLLEQGQPNLARNALMAAKNKGLADDLYQQLATRIGTAQQVSPEANGVPARRSGAFDPKRVDPIKGAGDVIPWVIGGLIILTLGALAFLSDGPKKPKEPAPPAPTDEG